MHLSYVAGTTHCYAERSVIPILDAKGVQHRTHLSVETTDAPANAVAEIIFNAADSVGADLVVLGANRKPVRCMKIHPSDTAMPLQVHVMADQQCHAFNIACASQSCSVSGHARRH